MKRWHIKNQNDIELYEATIPRKEGEVKLKVSKVAISATDLCVLAKEDEHIIVPGHSAIGYVSESDESSGLKLGVKAVISPFFEKSEFGKTYVETMGVDIDGLLQDFINIPQENVYVLPDGIPDEESIFTETIATCIEVFETLQIEKGDYIVIAGASTMGLILGQLAVYYQYVPILVDLDEEKLGLAKKFGIYYTINPTYDNIEKRIVEVTGGRKCDGAILAGEGTSLNLILRLLKDRGQVVITGYVSKDTYQIDTDVVLKKQLVIKGVNNGEDEIPTAINLLANKIVKTNGLINHVIGFEDVPKAVEDCVKYPYQYNKIMVDMD